MPLIIFVLIFLSPASWALGAECRFSRECWLEGWRLAPTNVDGALARFEKSCAMHLLDGCLDLALLHEFRGDTAKAGNAYEKLCAAQNPTGCVLLGSLRPLTPSEFWWASGVSLEQSEEPLPPLERAVQVALSGDDWHPREEGGAEANRSPFRLDCSLKKPRNCLVNAMIAPEAEVLLDGFDKACEAGNALACQRLANRDVGERLSSLAQSALLASAGPTISGEAWRKASEGTGLWEPLFRPALKKLEKLCEAREARACTLLAGVGIPFERESRLKDACRKNEPVGCLLLAGMVPSAHEAEGLLARSCALGLAQACEAKLVARMVASSGEERSERARLRKECFEESSLGACSLLSKLGLDRSVEGYDEAQKASHMAVALEAGATSRTVCPKNKDRFVEGVIGDEWKCWESGSCFFWLTFERICGTKVNGADVRRDLCRNGSSLLPLGLQLSACEDVVRLGLAPEGEFDEIAAIAKRLCAPALWLTRLSASVGAESVVKAPNSWCALEAGLRAARNGEEELGKEAAKFSSEAFHGAAVMMSGASGKTNARFLKIACRAGDKRSCEESREAGNRESRSSGALPVFLRLVLLGSSFLLLLIARSVTRELARRSADRKEKP